VQRNHPCATLSLTTFIPLLPLTVPGKVDNEGRLVFAELSGRVGWLKPNGGCFTTLLPWQLHRQSMLAWHMKPF